MYSVGNRRSSVLSTAIGNSVRVRVRVRVRVVISSNCNRELWH
jgi:hypothetical protein